MNHDSPGRLTLPVCTLHLTTPHTCSDAHLHAHPHIYLSFECQVPNLPDAHFNHLSHLYKSPERGLAFTSAHSLRRIIHLTQHPSIYHAKRVKLSSFPSSPFPPLSPVSLLPSSLPFLAIPSTLPCFLPLNPLQ